MNKLLAAAAGLAALGTANIAQANDLAHWSSVGGWSISGNSLGCHASGVWNGGTSMAIVAFADGTVGLSVSNADWARIFQPNVSYRIHFSFDGAKNGYLNGTFQGGPQGALHFLDLTPEFVTDFTAAHGVTLSINGISMDKLALTGSKRATVEAVRCALAMKGADVGNETVSY